MARIVKTAAIRQDEILDVAQRLFVERGYDNTPVQAIIDEIGIAKGTFYHHYASKPALLEALVARTVAQSLAVIDQIVAETAHLGAIERVNELFLRIGRWKAERGPLLMEMTRAMRATSGSTALNNTQLASLGSFMPVLRALVEQGVREGVFQTAYPHEAAGMMMDLSVSLSQALATVLLAGSREPADKARLVTLIDAYQDGICRILGAPPRSVHVVDPSLVDLWFPSLARTA